MEKVIPTIISTFCVALGVMLGGAILGSIGALITSRPPLYTMFAIAERIKIWAIFVALGDTFTTVRNIERGFLGGDLDSIIKQLLIIFSAFFGSHIGYIIVSMLVGSGGE